MRRGELRGLAWGALELDSATVRVERSLETAAGLRFKQPKTRRGRRTISQPTKVVEIMHAPPGRTTTSVGRRPTRRRSGSHASGRLAVPAGQTISGLGECAS
jgi:hypothetical protein